MVTFVFVIPKYRSNKPLHLPLSTLIPFNHPFAVSQVVASAATTNDLNLTSNATTPITTRGLEASCSTAFAQKDQHTFSRTGFCIYRFQSSGNRVDQFALHPEMRNTDPTSNRLDSKPLTGLLRCYIRLILDHIPNLLGLRLLTPESCTGCPGCTAHSQEK